MDYSNASRRRLILGGGAALGILVFLAIIVAIQYVVLQHPKRWDLTKGGRYTLAPQSKTVLASFKEKKTPIEVLAFLEAKEMGERERIRDLLDQYRDVYSGFTYSFIDPDKDRSVALKHKIDTYGTLLISAAGKDERLTRVDEESLTNALVKLMRAEVKKVYFLKGHGELSPEGKDAAAMSVAREEIEKQNYRTEELVLLQAPSVPEDAAILIIAGPTIDPMDSELQAIRDYLKRGGKLLVTLSPFKAPKLAAMLKDYGFETADDIVVDRMSKALGGDYLMPVITKYEDFPITKNFTLASFFPEARSIRVPKEVNPHLTSKELALTSPVSWTISEQQLRSGKADFDEKTGMRGPVPVMAVSTYTEADSSTEKSSEAKGSDKSLAAKAPAGDEEKGEGDKENPEAATAQRPHKARIVVFGSAQFASDKFFRLQGNGDLFMNTVSWLAEEESLIAIRPKSTRSQPLVLTSRQSLVIFLIPVVILPLAWFVAGIAIYWYRRRTAAA